MSETPSAAPEKPASHAPPPAAAHGHDGHGHGHDAHDPIHAANPNLAHHFDTPLQQFEAGKLGIWLFLLTEVLFFAGLFVAYTITDPCGLKCGSTRTTSSTRSSAR